MTADAVNEEQRLPAAPTLKKEAEPEAEAGPGAEMAEPQTERREAELSSNGSDKEVPASPDGAAIGPPPEEKDVEDRSKAQTAIIVAALCLCVLLAALDATIITTALPTISEHFHSSAGYTWIGSAYLLANSASIPSWGKFSDIFGRKPVLQTAAGVFFVGSALCGAAVSIDMLIIGRVIQGIGGGGLIILVNICISDLFSMRKRATYFGIVGMVWAFASGIGPILGGLFTQKASWRWCFYINLPCTGVSFMVIWFYLKISTPTTPLMDGLKAIDWLGSLTVVGGTVMFLLGLEFGGVTFPWSSPTVICLIVFGIVIFGLFIVNEWKFAKYPVMPLRLFHHRSNVAALSVCLSHGFVFIAGSYYLPLFFQASLGASPLLSGVYLLPFVLVLSLGSGIVGVVIRKTGRYREPIWFGITFMTLGFGLFINLDVSSGWAKIIIYQMIAGIGVGPNFQSPLIALQSRVSPRDIATATATFGFIRQLATSISVVVGGVVFQNGMQSQMAELTRTLGAQTASLLSGGSAGANVQIVDMLPAGPRDIAREAFAAALRKMWIVYVAVGAFGMVASLFIVQNTLSKVHHKTETGLAGEEARRVEAKAAKDEKRALKDVEKGKTSSPRLPATPLSADEEKKTTEDV
ncbi:MAG: hypothetical protein M4579_006061 [Chaenotheca gracillima]|nr:MAG: hypothetical protein M4579_006061 [Chaenotheca gracillima]